jgi:hypothetical protein
MKILNHLKSISYTLFLGLIVSTSVYGAQIAYIDASFGSCKVPQLCSTIRVETQLHALSAIGRDPLISRVTPGAMAETLVDDAIDLIVDWEEEGFFDFGPNYLVFGFANDFFFGDGDRIIMELKRLVAEYQARSPRTEILVIDYPPVIGAPQWMQNQLFPVAYETFRTQYKQEATKLGLNIIHAYDNWLASYEYHPNLPGPDYHLSQHSAIDAALIIYLNIRQKEQIKLFPSAR